MNPDPVQVVGFLGIYCAFSFLLVGAWVALVKLASWWYRWRARRADRELGPHLVAAEERGGSWWAPEWEAGWPEK